MQQRVVFKNSKGNSLTGIFSNPTASMNVPVVILCHGFGTSKINRTNANLEKLLNEKYIATLRFDFFGHGESSGKFENITVTEAVDDILNAISFLKQNGFSKIGLMGSSFGGLAATIAASRTENLFALVLKSPVADFQEVFENKKTKEEMENWKETGFSFYTGGKGADKKLNYSFYEDCETNLGYDSAPEIKFPTLIVHGDKDEVVPLEQSEKLSVLIPDCTLKVVEGADHCYLDVGHLKEMLKLIADFLIGKS